MGRKGNLAVFESSSISETSGDMPTKISVHALHIHPYLHEFIEPIPYDFFSFYSNDYSQW